MKLLILLLTLITTQSYAQKVYFAELNDKHISSMSGTGLDEKTFNKVIDDFESVGSSIAKSYNKTLIINRLWSDDTVNSDTETSGDTWIINSYGGLARVDGMTKDGFTTVLCHELGHHNGGFPKYSFSEQASTEGGADYSAILKNFRFMYDSFDNRGLLNNITIPEIVVQKCSEVYNTDKDIALCERSSLAGQTVSNILSQLSGDDKLPSFETLDTSKVDTTMDGHPAAQCRMQTYFSAALCNVDYKTKLSDFDPIPGACSEENGQSIGVRARCWYAPQK